MATFNDLFYNEQKCFDEAFECDNKSAWLKAMQEERNFLHENHTYDLVKLSHGKKA